MVSKTGLMEDLHAFQQKFEAFLKMYQEDKLANERRLHEINTQLEELSRNISTMRTDAQDDGDDERSRATWSDEGGYAYGTKYLALDFPSYDGETDPLGWLNRCDNFFRFEQTPKEDKVGLASLHLVGNSQIWFMRLKRDRPRLTWEDIKDECDLRFGHIHPNTLGELCKLRQDGTVDDYLHRFEQLAVRVSSLSTEQELEIFISGLQENIAAKVKLHRPKDLISAANMAALLSGQRN